MLTNEQHSKLMEELVDENTADGRKAIIVTDLVKDYADSISHRNEIEEKVQAAKKENISLLEAHHKLFKQSGMVLGGKKEEKTFSQKITITDMENRYKVY